MVLIAQVLGHYSTFTLFNFPDYCRLHLKYLFPDVNECLTSPCWNLGTCENVPGSYNCRCVAEWEGPNCEIGILRSLFCYRYWSSYTIITINSVSSWSLLAFYFLRTK